MKVFNLTVLVFIFFKNLIAMPGMEDPMADFPEGDLEFSQDIQMPPPIPGGMPGPVPMPIPQPISAPMLAQQFPVSAPIPAQQLPVSAGPTIPGAPTTVAPSPVVPSVTENQFPWIDAGPDKQKNLTEATPPLIQTPRVAELQNILDRAEQTMQRIKNNLDLIENLRKNLYGQFSNIDKQLDITYQTLGFERGKQTKELEKKEKEFARALAQ
ncbi:MAG: hypothetical protein ABIA74_02620 [bacterium]